MGYQIIKQPNNLFCVFSSINDDFCMVDATKDEIINYFVEMEKEKIINMVEKTIIQIDKNEKPYFQFTKSFYSARNFLKENSFFDKVYIGSLVKKISGKPFKSCSKENTVKSIINHPILKDELAFTFMEDDSIVEIRKCVLT